MSGCSLPERRQFLIGSTTLASGLLLGGRLRAASAHKFKAVAFDAFPVFDPRPVFALAETLLPGHGAELSNVWRTRQFEYTWLRALSDRYTDFWNVSEDALDYALTSLKLDMERDKRAQLMSAYLKLKAWPDAAQALNKMKSAGLRLAFLSNFTPRMLEAAISNAGLDGVFEHALSTDRIRSYKPDPRAYQLGVDAFGLSRSEILFVAFAGWDAAGAKAFGFPTYWVNRLKAPLEELGEIPDGIGADLSELVTYLDV